MDETSTRKVVKPFKTIYVVPKLFLCKIECRRMFYCPIRKLLVWQRGGDSKLLNRRDNPGSYETHLCLCLLNCLVIAVFHCLENSPITIFNERFYSPENYATLPENAIIHVKNLQRFAYVKQPAW